ncbi:MAG: ROK family protein [Brachybacterium sp.]|uniref:ROK family transcriptional regulator n=1 Tax=Brachybacterium sp. TaxID=1891286 RepID=UPI00264A0813|nr:ROK family transcriptional regulator [Brachybacterium sp.]MDN5686162.1 ROK family protein [Brachybacterium sp.]
MQGSEEHRAAETDAVAALGGDSARAVYRDLLRFGPRSRSELTARLGLSAPTVTRVTRDLLDAGRLHQLGAVVRAKGRPHEPLDIEENLGPRFIGVKVTADEIHAVVTTVRGNVLEELVLPVADTAPEAVIDAVLAPAQALAEAHPHLAGVGVSLGGPVADRRRVLSSYLLGWEREFDVATALETRLKLPVVVENDLVAMVNGLHWFGIGRSYRSFAVLTVGAGIGTGTVIDGRLIEGRNHVAGLTGRLPIGRRTDGTPLPVREVASTDSILRRAHASAMLTADQGMDELRCLLANQDPDALEAAGELARALAAAAAGLVATVDPDAIVLGGENVDLVRAVGPVFEDTLRGAISAAQQGLVVRVLSGDFDEWARGAAVIAIQEFVGVES